MIAFVILSYKIYLRVGVTRGTAWADHSQCRQLSKALEVNKRTIKLARSLPDKETSLAGSGNAGFEEYITNVKLEAGETQLKREIKRRAGKAAGTVLAKLFTLRP